jgi:peptide/nickel transport system substrate-binding protein
VLSGLVLAILALAAFWYGHNAASGPRSATHGGRYVEAIVGAPSIVNPLYATFNDVDKDLTALIYSGLTRLGPDGTVLPDLAVGWTVGADARSYTFRLRSGVTWHDGAPFSADDVIFTCDALRDPDFKGEPSLGLFWQQVTCTKLDDLTVRFELPQALAPFPAYATIGILPKHKLEGLTAEGLFLSPFNELPIGTGPFVLTYLDCQRATLRSNPTYHGSQPFIDELELWFFPDYAEATAAFEKQRVYVGCNLPPGAAPVKEIRVDGLLLGPEAPPAEQALLDGRADLQHLVSRRNSYTLLFLNTRVPFLDDKTVRQAILYALDRPAILASVLDGRADLADSPIVPGTWAYSEDIRKYPHDPQEARDLLEAAGWKQNAWGFLEKDGQELSLSLLTDPDPARASIGQEIVRQLGEAGIHTTQQTIGGTALVDEFLLPRRFQMTLWGWDQGPDPDPYAAWHSSQVREQGFNLSGFSDPHLDEVLSEARQTSDQERRRALYAEFQQIFAEEVPSVLLFYPLYHYYVSDDVKGIDLGVLFEPSSRFDSIQQWYIKTKRSGMSPP